MGGKKKSFQASPAAAVPSVSMGKKEKKKSGGLSGWQMGLAAAAALFGLLVMTGGATNSVTFVSAQDEAMLRRLFFSGEIWAVACHSINSTTPLSENFEAVANRLHDEMNFAVLDCKAPLPGSGRTTMQRWKLKQAKRDDAVLFVANGVTVKQIAPQAMRSEYEMMREFRLNAIRVPQPIKNTEQLREKCVGKPRCLLVLKGGAELEPRLEKALHNLAGAHANGGEKRTDGDGGVVFAALDSQDLKLSFEGYDAGENIKLRRFETDSHRAIYFRNASSSSSSSSSSNSNAAAGVSALAVRGVLSENSLSAFLDGVSHDTNEALNKRLVSLKDPISLYKRAANKPKRKAPPSPPKEIKAQPLPKSGETLSPEDREKLLKEQRDREAARRDAMDQEAADSAYTVQEADDYEDGDAYFSDDADEEEILELD